MSGIIDRRTLLMRGVGLGALMLGGGFLLEGCSSGTKATSGSNPAATSTGPTAAATSTGSAAGSGTASGSASVAAGAYGDLEFRLDWIKHVEFAGEFIADTKGYYIDEGFASVNLIAGGPTATPSETDLVQGKAFIGLSSPSITAAAVQGGAPLKAIGATYQRNPYCILSLDKDPLPDPQSMVGKKIGVQAANTAPFLAFLKANNIDPKSLTTVPVQYDPLVLTTGSIDGWFGFSTDEPIQLKLKGFPNSYFLLADHGYGLVGQIYITRQDSIDNHRDALKAVLRAEVRGWKDNLNTPKEGVDLATTKYGADLKLDPAAQILSAVAANELIVSPDTMKNGLLTMTQDLIDLNVRIMATPLTADKLFDLSLINEIYKESPDLISKDVPTAPVTS